MRVTALILAVAMALPAAAAAEDRVVLAPLSTLGSEVRDKQTARIRAQLEAGIASIDQYTLVGEDEMLAAVARAKRPQLRTCEGNDECLAALGALLGARFVIYGELGGLGDAQVLTLEVIDVGAGKQVRSTTAQFSGAKAQRAARAAAFRLLAPARYVGTVALDVDVPGASVFIDGTKVAESPAAPLAVEVGHHALRVTHSEYRDFVRFIEVPFDETVALEVPLQAFPIIDREMRGNAAPVGGDTGPREAPTPWYRRWYTIAGAGVAVFVVSAVAIGLAADGIDADREHDVDR